MEITRAIKRKAVRYLLVALGLLCVSSVFAQNVSQVFVRDNRMYIELRKDISEKELSSFVERYDLSELALKAFLRSNMQDSLRRHGWVLESNTSSKAVFYRPLFPAADLQDPAARFKLTSIPDPQPEGNFGANRFVNKHPFAVRDSSVVFFLRGQPRAGNVQLAGSFTDWQRHALRMTRVDSGWIATVRLAPGKHWYKFIVDGNWQTDRDNQQQEGDGRGNTNSVYFKTNYVFTLAGNTDAHNVVLSGSFNNWNREVLRLLRKSDGWYLPAYVGEGTFLYKYVVDGRWLIDPANRERLDDGHGSFNSVLRKGRAATFVLNGFTTARKVAVAGNFNDWRGDELYLQKNASGWALPYVLAAGNYEYKFIVDGRWMPDPGNLLNTEGPNGKGNSILVVGANYTFRIKGKPDVKTAFVAGDFNDWNPRSLPMRREGSDWVLPLYLPAGKHRYKFLANGTWILDPGNKLWEQNEFNTGNSVLWVN
jgi:1,4-alpha-glucan branching enzyme